MNYDTITLSICAVVDEHLPEVEAEKLKNDSTFMEKHVEAAIGAISTADPHATDLEAAGEAMAVYTETIRADIRRLYPKTFIANRD